MPGKALEFLWLDDVEVWDGLFLGETSKGMDGLQGHCLEQADNTDHLVIWEGKMSG